MISCFSNVKDRQGRGTQFDSSQSSKLALLNNTPHCDRLALTVVTVWLLQVQDTVTHRQGMGRGWDFSQSQLEYRKFTLATGMDRLLLLFISCS